MSTEQSQWNDVKNNYLQLIQQSLASLDHPRRSEILSNVAEHLERKYAELSPGERTWESFQRIITEMGPPADYAALLCDDIIHANRTRPSFYTLLAAVFVIVLLLVGAHLIINSKKMPPQTTIKTPPSQTPVPQGQTPEPPISDQTTSAPQVKPVEPNVSVAAGVKQDQEVAEPNLSHINQKNSIQSSFAAEPTVLGKWIAVDYVPKTDDFVPDQRQYKKTLILRALQFIEPSTVYWSFNNNVVKQTSFGEAAIETVNGYSARYTIKTLEGQDYLFVDWMTVDVIEGKQSAWRYVLKRENMDLAAEASEQQSDESDSGIVNNSNVLGKWVSVDFVREMDQFDPSQKFWRDSLYLTGLEFQNNKRVWFSFNNNSRFQHSWVPGKVEAGQSRPAFYTVKNIDGNLYMFFEWISGDVTIRGQKPCYYVLKQTTSPQRAAGKVTNRKVVIGANYCTMDFIQSKFGQATRREEKMLRYPGKGVDFGFFKRQLLLSEVHLNQGYQGQLKTGISMTSTMDDVFRVYGSPLKILQAADLHGIKDERILYQKGDTSRIYYGKHGLIFWFQDEAVLQIIVFKGEAEVEF